MSDDRNLILLCELPVFALQRGESGFWRVLMPRLSWQHPAPSVVAVIEEPRPRRSARCSGLILRVIEISDGAGTCRQEVEPCGEVPSLQKHHFNSATPGGSSAGKIITLEYDEDSRRNPRRNFGSSAGGGK